MRAIASSVSVAWLLGGARDQGGVEVEVLGYVVERGEGADAGMAVPDEL